MKRTARTPNNVEASEIVMDISLLNMWDILSSDMREKFCKVDQNGCLKYKECDLSHSHPECYHNKNGWCPQLINEREDGDFRPNPSAIRMKACKECTDRNYRDCNPCSYYGCIIGGDDKGHCPYAKVSKERNNFDDFRLNPYRHIWCYITSFCCERLFSFDILVLRF